MIKVKIKPLRMAPIATAIVARVKSAIESAVGDRWDKTGRLLSSVRMVESPTGAAGVAIAEDRLQNEHTRQLFADECLPDPTNDTRVRNAIAKVVHDAINVEVAKK